MPVSKPLPAAERDRLVARLNGVLGGILEAESWVPSRGFYFGGITGQPPVQVELSEGRCIDECAALDATAIGRPWRNGVGSGAGSGGHTGPDGRQGAGNGAVDEAALLAVIAAGDHYKIPVCAWPDGTPGRGLLRLRRSGACRRRLSGLPRSCAISAGRRGVAMWRG
jgi:hypothetical protein